MFHPALMRRLDRMVVVVRRLRDLYCPDAVATDVDVRLAEG